MPLNPIAEKFMLHWGEMAQRWGPLFIPAYLTASLLQLVRGRRPYEDNPFEREAYAAAE